ncbi:YihY/virulence factor BrkB family protein [Geomonas anaerohicana]|uniref:YihY/virulence factor BrkB family protein n=1 Tax=Geomonas anaerohicana TaxID=2798583 RepID=A0ABS0Y904_9BACT|nr:YihY/virulence factor BrkB family protein [Geomonas anaerohicana]MBJ6748770.1 YihY/virulence factor BrkB family protein [Geomonas anaerohicana]
MCSLRSYFKLGDASYMDLAKKVYRKFSDEDCPEHAAAMAYYFLFASFPFLLFLTTLIGYLPIPHLMDYMLANAAKFLPSEAFSLIESNIRALFMNKKQGLLSFGILLALWASSNAIVSVMDAMNNLYDVKEGRPFWKVRLTAIGLVVGLSLLILCAMALLMFGVKIADFIAGLINFGVAFKVGFVIGLIPVTLFLLVLAVAVIYYFTPDVEHAWKWISPGAVVAIPCWVVMSFGFSYYINNFGSYDKTYGSIGAVIVLLLWLYLSGLIILAGAVINAVIEHSSEEGKEPGEKVEGEHAAERGTHSKAESQQKAKEEAAKS